MGPPIYDKLSYIPKYTSDFLVVISFLLIVLLPQSSLRPQDFVIIDLDCHCEYAHLQFHTHLYLRDVN